MDTDRQFSPSAHGPAAQAAVAVAAPRGGPRLPDNVTVALTVAGAFAVLVVLRRSFRRYMP